MRTRVEDLLGKEVRVTCTKGLEYRGVLENSDAYLNITLVVKATNKKCFIRGSTITRIEETQTPGV